MTRSKCFNELVYPLKGYIRFEIDDFSNFGIDRYSDVVTVGKTKWRLLVRKEPMENPSIITGKVVTVINNILEKVTNDEEVLSPSRFGPNAQFLSFYLINLSPIHNSKTIETKQSYHLIKPGKGDKVQKVSHSYTCADQRKGYPCFKKFSNLVRDGYVSDYDKIIVKCYFDVLSEDGVRRERFELTEERPSKYELREILDRNAFAKSDRITKAIQLSQIQGITPFSVDVSLFGLPGSLSFTKNQIRGCHWLRVSLSLNHRDSSEWWMLESAVEFRILNTRNDKSVFSPSILCTFRRQNRISDASNLINWSQLESRSEGCLTNGLFKIEVIVRVFNAYGFDERTRRGIERPIKRMTDKKIRMGHDLFPVCQRLLSQQSTFFKDLFSSNNGNEIFSLQYESPADFKRFLALACDSDTDICVGNARGVLELSEKYRAEECFKKCDVVLKESDFISNMPMVMKLLSDYPDKLPDLKIAFFKRLHEKNEYGLVTESKEYENISSEMRIAIHDKRIFGSSSPEGDENRRRPTFCNAFSDITNETNLKVSVDGEDFFVSKDILANSSNYFLKRFFGPYSEEEETEITLFDLLKANFLLLLLHIYHSTRPVTLFTVDDLLELARRFEVQKLSEKCEKWLVTRKDFSLSDKLQYAGNYDLRYLLESCLKETKTPSKLWYVRVHHNFDQLSREAILQMITRGHFANYYYS